MSAKKWHLQMSTLESQGIAETLRLSRLRGSNVASVTRWNLDINSDGRNSEHDFRYIGICWLRHDTCKWGRRKKSIAKNSRLNSTQRFECDCSNTDVMSATVYMAFKGALCCFGREIVITTGTSLSSFSLLKKQVDRKGQHSFILFYFVYMWRTLPPF